MRLAYFFYNILMFLLIPIIPFFSKRLKTGFNQRILKNNTFHKADIWFLASSRGEARIAFEIISNLKFTHKKNILITFYTKEGMELFKSQRMDNKNISIYLGFTPFDKASIIKKTIEQICPKLIVFIETEIWPNLLLFSKKKGIKSFIVNGRINKKNFKSYIFLSKLFNFKKIAPSKIFAITNNDAQRFKKIFHTEKVKMLENIKFDSLWKNTKGRKISRFINSSNKFILFASISKNEENAIIKIILKIQKKFPKANIAIFPSKMDRIKKIATLLKKNSIDFFLRTKIKKEIKYGKLILWDKVGELKDAYEFADAAFIGGSLVNKGGQNFLESLEGGLIPVIGKYWDDFFWAGSDITQKGLLNIAKNRQEAEDILINDIKNPQDKKKNKALAFTYFKKKQGSTKEICKEIEEAIKEEQKL